MSSSRRESQLLLALDLGTKTGWSVWKYDSAGNRSYVDSGTVSLGSDGPTRVFRFRQALRELFARFGVPAQVAYELVYRHLGTQACHVYGALEGILQLEVEERKIGMHPVTVQGVKKVATGKGNAPKEQVFAAAVRRWGPQITTHDQADACWIGEVALREQHETD